MRKEQTAPPHPGRGCAAAGAAGIFKKTVGAAGLFKKAVGAAGRYPKRRFWRWVAYRCGTGVSLLLKTDSGFLSERMGGSCRWKKIRQFSKIRCNLPPHRIQYKYRAGPIDADGSSADIFIGRVVWVCGGIEKTEKDEMRSTMSDMIG